MRKGFTIIELLVVIVVIAILTTISVVSYNGIQARSKAASAQTLANDIVAKAKGWYTATGIYPSYTQLSTGKLNPADVNKTGPAEAFIKDSSTIFDGSSANPTNEKSVGYIKCSPGAQVEWYDATTRTIKYVGVGGASSTAAC